MTYIKVIPPDQAQGTLKAIYDNLLKQRGKIAAVHMIQSLNPESIQAHMDLYMRLMFGQSPLKRWQREMIAVVVSVVNQCPYCIAHHAEALNHFWKDKNRINRLISDYRNCGLDDRDIALCHFAERLTVEPSGTDIETRVNGLKKAGFDDRAILDATLIIAYFNFVNRIVLGLGVDLEADGGKGYRYD